MNSNTIDQIEHYTEKTNKTTSFVYKEGLLGRGRDHVLLYDSDGQDQKLGSPRAARERGRLDRGKASHSTSAPVLSVVTHSGVSSVRFLRTYWAYMTGLEVDSSMEEEDGLENLLRSHSLSGFQKNTQINCTATVKGSAFPEQFLLLKCSEGTIHSLLFHFHES